MSNFTELTTLLRELLHNRFQPMARYTKGLLGDGMGNVVVPDKPDHNYVRQQVGGPVFTAFNKTVSNPVDNWPIILGESHMMPGVIQIIGTDWAAYERTGWGADMAGIQAHAPTHEWPDFAPGSDPVDVYLRALVPLRTYSAGSGTQSVYVSSLYYEHQSTGTLWPGLPLVNLAPATPPTGSMVYMGAYLNPATNTIQLVTGTQTVYTDALEPPKPTFPGGVIPTAWVRLYGGQATITERDIRDARRLFGVASSGGGGAPSGPAGGDLTGSYPNPTVKGLLTYPFVGTPANNQIPMYTGSTIRWINQAASSSGAWPYPKVLTVDPTGTNAQYNDIQAAVNAAAPGDTLLLGDGTFSRTTTVTINKSLHLQALNPLGTTITTSTTGVFNFTVTAADVSFNNLTITNLSSGSSAACILSVANNLSINGCMLNKTAGTPTNGAALWLQGGQGIEINESELIGTSGINAWAMRVVSGSSITLNRSLLNGTLRDINSTATGTTITSNSNTFTNGSISISGGGLFTGNQPDLMLVKNTSGDNAFDGDVGYLDENGEYKTTTTANALVNWCVVAIGANNNANIFVKRTGRVTVNYTGSDPAVGDYLVTSTTGGQAQGQAYVDPSIFGVCEAAGSGGTVDVLLLTNRVLMPVTSANTIHQVLSADTANFLSTIDSLPGGAAVRYDTPSSGNENTIVPNANDLAKIRLYNSTRGTYALISSVSTTGGAGYDGEITVTNSADISAWQAGDTITTRSQTNTSSPIAGMYFFDMEFTSSQIDALAVAFIGLIFFRDTTGANVNYMLHPWEANSNNKRFAIKNQVANVSMALGTSPVPIINRRFCLSWSGSGSATVAIASLQLFGVYVAAP